MNDSERIVYEAKKVLERFESDCVGTDIECAYWSSSNVLKELANFVSNNKERISEICSEK